ncbi:MAG: hypothetical protein OXD54_04030 [Candidatus Poribacteria bacterium]|nr:hypothetical protein [Candidatus Poribacteria bacterium]
MSFWWCIRVYCLNQDLPNQEINGMNTCWRSPKSTPNARMAFVGYECLLAFPGILGLAG